MILNCIHQSLELSRLGRENFKDQNAYLQSCFPNEPQLERTRRRGNECGLDWRELMEVQEERLQDEEEARLLKGKSF